MMIGRRRHKELTSRLSTVEAGLERLTIELRAALKTTDRLAARDGDGSTDTLEELSRLREILQLIYDREPESRERLRRLRQDPSYERAFVDEEPLVSVIIATYDRGELLVSRAIPSVLAQTYQNFEIVVVGDSAPQDTALHIATLGDERVRYQNLPHRGPYPDRPRDLWHVAGVPPRNAAASLARGRWIAPLDDDDAFHEHHIEHLLALAQREQLEVAYGQLRCLMSDGSEFSLGEYPPKYGQFGWQGAIFHAGLRFFEMELADALFFSPADWSLCRRMLRAGVRFGMLPELVTDHYESRFGTRPDETGT
jgi:Glycosyltransferase like family 2